MTDALTVPFDRTVELDVLVAVARYYGWQDRLPSIVAASYDPDVRYLGHALLLLAERSEHLNTVYEIRVDGRPCELEDALGQPSADVVLTVPLLRDALDEVEAPNPERLAGVFEAGLRDATETHSGRGVVGEIVTSLDAFIDQLLDIARDRELMRLSADIYNGIGTGDRETAQAALQQLREIAA